MHSISSRPCSCGRGRGAADHADRAELRGATHSSNVSCRNSDSPETPTPTRRSAPGRSRSPRSRSQHASSAIRSASSIGAASVVERLLIEKSEYRSFVVTVRAESRRCTSAAATSAAMRSDLGVEERSGRRCPARTSPRPRSRPAPSPSSRSRGSIPRARSRSSGPIVPGSTTRSSASPRAARSPIVFTPAAASADLGLRPDAGQRAHGERSEEPRLLPRRHDRDPARLAPVGGDLADDLRRRDAERARERGRGAHRRLHRLGHGPGAGERGHDGAEIEVALVDPDLLDARHDLADRAPDRLRVLPVERVARPDEDDLGAAAQSLGRAHRRADAERAGRRSSPSRRRRDPADSPPTTSGFVRSDGSSSSSTAAKNASRSRWARIGTRTERYGSAVITAPPPPPAIEQPAPYQVSYGVVSGIGGAGDDGA